MPQSGNADANRRAQDKPSARSAPATPKSTTDPAKTVPAKSGTAKPAAAKSGKPHSGNGSADTRAKSKPATPNAENRAKKDAEKKTQKDKKKSKKLLKRLEKAAKGDKSKDKAKKKSHSSGKVNAEIDYESRMNREEAVAYFDALVAGLKQGSVRFKQGDETVVIRPAELVDVEIKARSSGRKEKVRFEISWLSEYSGKMSITSD